MTLFLLTLKSNKNKIKLPKYKTNNIHFNIPNFTIIPNTYSLLLKRLDHEYSRICPMNCKKF